MFFPLRDRDFVSLARRGPFRGFSRIFGHFPDVHSPEVEIRMGQTTGFFLTFSHSGKSLLNLPLKRQIRQDPSVLLLLVQRLGGDPLPSQGT